MSFTPSENPITNPTRESYTVLRPFRFWCQKVLPLVYDDSLSYYELLCKVVDYLNKTMEDVDHMNTDMDTLYDNFQEFQEGTFKIYNELVAYVNAYFDELDVQEEINNKLDEMASDGRLTSLIAPLLPSLITAWLEENITPTTPVIDKSLTVSGAGADSKTTGNKINMLYQLLYDITGITPYTFTYNAYIKTNENVGSVVNLTPVNADPEYGYVIIPCSENDIFVVNTIGGNASRAWCFIDDENKVISKADNGAVLNNYTLTAPTNSNKLIVNVVTDNISAYVYNAESVIALINKIVSDINEFKSSADSRIGLETYDFISNGYIRTNLAIGSTINLTPVNADSEYHFCIIECNEGEKFTVSTIGGNASRAWAFIDSNNNLLSVSGIAITADDLVLTAPINASKLIVNSVTTNHPYYAYKNESILKQLNDKYDILSEGTFDKAVEDFTLGKIYNFLYDTIDTSDVEVENRKMIKDVPFIASGTGTKQSARTDFIDTSGYFSFVVFCESNNVNTNFTLYARIKSPQNTYRWKTVQANIPHNTNYELSVDLAHYAIYENAEKMAFIMTSENDADCERTITLKSDPYVTKYKTLSTFGYTLGSWLENLNNSLSSEGNNYRNNGFKVTPNGNKYVSVLNDNLTETLVSVNPTNVLFIGNSLLIGYQTFGMSASEASKDYANLFKAYVDDISNAPITINRKSGVDWENATSLSGKNSWVDNNIDSTLLNNVDLIVVQLGDNSSEVQSAFFYDACVYMLRAIRNIRPLARVCWMGSWYSQTLMKYAQSACDTCGAIFVDITNLVTESNRASLGYIVHFDDVRTTQYTDVDHYTNNGDNTITIYYNANNTVMSGTIPFTSVSGSAPTISVTSDYYLVTKTGVASHPNDRGFRAITNKLLYDLFISDLTNTYPLD